jgi:hypothetical protein
MQRRRPYVIDITTLRTTTDGGAGRLSTRRSTRDQYLEQENSAELSYPYSERLNRSNREQQEPGGLALLKLQS